MIWLLKWQQTVWIILLASLVGSSGMISIAPAGRERLAGWWLMEEQSSYGPGLPEWVERRVRVPLWLAQGYAWAVVGGWTGVMLVMGWQIWGAGGTLWSCAVVTVASHQVRTGLNRVVEVRHWTAAEQTWQELGASFNETEVRGLVSLARQGLIEPPDPVEAADKPAEAPPARAVGQSPAKTMGQALAQVVARQAIGTNLGLLLFLWMLVSGTQAYWRAAELSSRPCSGWAWMKRTAGGCGRPLPKENGRFLTC